MKDEEIDFSDLPEIPPEAFARAIVRKGCSLSCAKLRSPYASTPRCVPRSGPRINR